MNKNKQCGDIRLASTPTTKDSKTIMDSIADIDIVSAGGVDHE